MTSLVRKPQPRRTQAPRSWLRLAVLGVIAATPLVAGSESPAQAQDSAQRQSGRGQTAPTGENGITIGRAKVFDNRTLTLLLESLSETLKGLQVIDQDPLEKAIGLLQGSQTRDVARAASLLAGGSPKVVTTREGTSQADLEAKLTGSNATDNGKAKESVEALIDRRVSEKLGLKQETAASERNPALPTLPDLIASPSGLPAFGQNAADLLTDQVNLTYQILNLRMVLERSLSDRLLTDGNGRLQTVLGFNVSIDPPRDAEHSAAVVEVTINAVDGKPVSLVALMPQEKTYNSATLNTSSNAFGGSAVAGMFTIGFSERRRGQVFYLFRDNDTLSFERMITKDEALTFGWQFRPVLGRKSVSPGMRQMFAVISVPVSDAAKRNEVQELKVSARTYWRKYYRDTLTTSDRNRIGVWPHLRRIATLGLSEAVPNGKEVRRPEAGEEPVLVPTTANYQKHLAPRVTGVHWTRIDEKMALISIEGDNFFSGTSVAMGGSASASGVVIKSTQAMDVVTPIENIGAGTAVLIGRYGMATVVMPLPRLCDVPSLETATLGPPLGGMRELRVWLESACPASEIDRQLVVLVDGAPVPGAPQVLVDPKKPGKMMVNLQVPTRMIPKGDGAFAIISPFRSPFRIEFPWYENPYELKRVTAGKRTILFVRRFDDIELTNTTTFGNAAASGWKVEYAGTNIVPTFPNAKVMRFELADAKAEGTIALFEPSTGKGPNVYLLDLPPAKPRQRDAIEPVDGDPLVIAQNDAPQLAFTGERIGDVVTVRVEGREPFKTTYDATKKNLSVYVPQEATKLPAVLTLQFNDAAGKLIATQKLEIKARAEKAPAGEGRETRRP